MSAATACLSGSDVVVLALAIVILAITAFALGACYVQGLSR